MEVIDADLPVLIIFQSFCSYNFWLSSYNFQSFRSGAIVGLTFF